MDRGNRDTGFENPFIGNNLPACWDLGKRTMARFGPITDPTLPKECTVKPGTKIFVVGSSFECSTFDNDCGRQDEDPPPGCDGTTADDLLRCARDMNDEDAPTITVDGQSVKVTPVETTMPTSSCPRTTSSASQRGRRVCPRRTAGSLS